MKRSCKDINLKDWGTLIPYVRECIHRHYKRWDFGHLLIRTGKMNQDVYKAAVLTNDKAALEEAIENIAKEAAERVRNRDLKLAPVVIREKVDSSSFKVRLIGKESAMQQIFDHIAVGAAMPIFERRIVPQQASSVKGRGQVYGTCRLQKWIQKDYRAERWAKKHHEKYIRRCRVHAKCDIKNCYASAKYKIFMALFRRDCGNEDLLWLWETLLKSHHVDGYTGFMIGAWVSQWAMQYMMSFAYRHVMGLHTVRRGKPVKLVSHMLIYMDDMAILGTSKRNLRKAIRELIRFVKEELGMDIKPNWHICKPSDTPLDMMGFVIRSDGSVTLRPRIFLRVRRQALRFMRTGRMNLSQAKRICSYKGYFLQRKPIEGMIINLKNRTILKRLRFYELFRKAQTIVSTHERKMHNYGKSLLYGRTV